MNVNTISRLRPAAIVLLAATAAYAQGGGPGEAPPVEATRLAGSVYLLSGGAGANSSALVGADGVLLVDSKMGDASGAGIADALRGLSSGNVRFLVNTHEHPDHIGNNAMFAAQGAEIIAHEEVRSVLAAGQRGGPPAPAEALPVATFGDGGGMTLRLDGETVEIRHMPGAHTASNALVHYVNANVYHLGDLYTRTRYPVLAGGTIDGFIAAADQVLEMSNADSKFIPGIGDVGDRADLIAFRKMLVTVRDRVAELVKQGKSLDEVAAAKPTAEFDATYGDPSRLFLPVIYTELAVSN